MSSNLRKGSYTVSRLTCYIVWSTKYRYKVLQGNFQICCRALLIQVSESQGIEILKGVVCSDYLHMHIGCAPKLNISSIVKSLKGCSSRRLQQEFPSLRKRY